MAKIRSLNAAQVLRAYARWAPVYDQTFGLIADFGRRQTVDHINNRRGRVLEVGVGTGISLPHYKRELRITAIDVSPEMLRRARSRVDAGGLDHVEAVMEMDAGALGFADESFDIVVAMYVMTVVPDPDRVMAELERVCTPGGEVIIVNHFSQEYGLRGWLERRLAPFAATLGWRPEFPIDVVMTRDRLRLVEKRRLKPFGLFTMLRFVRQTERASDAEPDRENARETVTAGASGHRSPLGDTA
ncbi:MAG: methyltransferase domain-containing protein [Hyphomicrobiales bacterium]|nr:methyltransferase domain-containing protein [Hyphomicrobiales bacterium]